MTPYAATPFSPANFISWKLYKILTMDAERFVTISEEPFVQVFRKIFPLNFAFVKRNKLLFFLAKKITGTMPPMISPSPVAMAAPAIPQWQTAIKTKSSIMLVKPEAIDIFKLKSGFCAVMKKLWKIFCSMKAGCVTKRILPYTIQLSKSFPSAPKKIEIGRIKIKHIADMIMPITAAAYTSIEKY